MAISAFAAQQQPAKNRDVVVGLDGAFAARTVGCRRNDGNAFRNARDANIQEAAKNNAEKEKEERDHTVACATPAQRDQYAPKDPVSDGYRAEVIRAWRFVNYGQRLGRTSAV